MDDHNKSRTKDDASHASRLAFLDGLRGLAILLVILFHAYSRYPALYPFGAEYARSPLIAQGWVGVELFFIISGYVIFMTLEKCRKFADFITRRWLRLFPAMLACSLLVFATAAFFPERPRGVPTLRDLLPGLTFMEPDWWAWVLGSPQGMIEGAFWSLFVEMKFYLVFGLLYFAIGGNRAVFAIAGLFLATQAMGAAKFLPVVAAVNGSLVQQVAEQLSLGSFGWFAGGALFYRYQREPKRANLWMAIGMTVLAALALGGVKVEPKLPALLVAALFSLSIVSERTRALLGNPVLLLLGFVSYPLYLLHENTMVALTIKVGALAPGLPHYAMPLAPMLVVITLAWIVARWVEPWLRGLVLPGYNRVRSMARV